MSDSPQVTLPLAAVTTPSDLAHITEEMYKKNFELAEKNKTLSLLRKIDELILNSATEVQQIAQQVVDVAATDSDFTAAVIYLYDANAKLLRRIAVSQTKFIQSYYSASQHFFYPETITVYEASNRIAQCFREKNMQVVTELMTLLQPYLSENEVQLVKNREEIHFSLVYPLVVRGLPIGVLTVSLGDDENKISSNQHDLIDRLVTVVGIAMDNALLYQHTQEANEQLKTLDKLKDEFVSIASHELRTPMTSIRSYLWMALEGKGGMLLEKQAYYVQRAYNSVDRLIKLVNDMLNVSRIESGRISLEMKRIDLVVIFQEVIDDLLPRSTELGIQLVLDKNGASPVVLADPDKIREVVFNLIGNSLKFTPNGGSITISFVSKDGKVESRLTDTGAGIDPDNLPHLFQKFGILLGSYTTNQSAMIGTGLGLYICKSIVELHGGKIWAESEGNGKGSTFIFSLLEFSEAKLKEFQTIHPSDQKEHIGLEHTQL